MVQVNGTAGVVGPGATADQQAPPRPIALLLPGQGSQHPRMAAGLYGWDPVFTETMDTVFHTLGANGRHLRDDWLQAEPLVCIDDVTRAQPLLFAVDVALARMVQSWGLQPAALLGHSVGELAAGVLADIMALSDAAHAIWDRACRLTRLPSGGMLAVACAPGDVQRFLCGEVVVGAVNAPRQTMLAGPTAPLADVAESLRAAGYTCREVRATTAFHSPAVRPAVSTDVLSAVPLSRPRTPLWSGYTMDRLTAEEAMDPQFWAGHPAEPVYFGTALDGLLDSAALVLLETGPGQGLTQLARRHPCVRRGSSAAVALLPPVPRGDEADRCSVREAAAWLCAEGHRLRAVGDAVTTRSYEG